MAETATRRHARGNGAYKPTLADLDRRLLDHEKEDQDRHEEVNQSIKSVHGDVREMKATLATIVTERQASELFEKWKQKLLIGGLTVAGIVVPLGTAIWDHLSKAP